jgi:hypothetical protein
MKKILTFIAQLISIIFLFSCNVNKDGIPRITDKEASEYSIQNDTIYLRNEKIAYLSLVEWEYYKGKLVQEISLVQIDRSGETLKLISFVRKKHPRSKIEVKFKEEN